MTDFTIARRRHVVVGSAAADDIAAAAALWGAVSGAERPDAKTLAGAVADTVPVEHAALLQLNDVAASYAFGLMWALVEPKGATSLKRRDMAREAWAVFDKRATQTEELANGFGWDLSAAWEHAGKVSIAGGDMSAVRRVAALAGRMHAALRGARATKVAGVPTSVHSTELGASIARLLPSETMLLGDAQLEPVVLARIVGRKAAQYAMRGDDKRSRGPFVIAVDESGSMAGARNEWSRAAIVALARVAQAEKRPVAVVHYSTSCKAQKMAFDPESMGKVLAHFLNGGTAIGLALDNAAEEVQRMASAGQAGADVVLITDGIDGNEKAQAAAVERLLGMSARLWTVAIECDITNVLRTEASQYVRLGGPDLTDGKSVVALAGAV